VPDGDGHLRLCVPYTLYEQDYYAWTKEQAAKLRAGRVTEIDLEDLAEEIESMGRSEWYELVNRLAVLSAHLLKWRCQPSRRSKAARKMKVDESTLLTHYPFTLAQVLDNDYWPD